MAFQISALFQLKTLLEKWVYKKGCSYVLITSECSVDGTDGLFFEPFDFDKRLYSNKLSYQGVCNEVEVSCLLSHPYVELASMLLFLIVI